MVSPVKSQDMVFEAGALRFASDRITAPDPSLLACDNPVLNAQPVQVGGRQAAWFVQGGFGSAVLRYYRRGGLVARFSRDRYVWLGAKNTRSFAEFDVLNYMFGLGLAVPQPLLAGYWRSGLTYRAAILLERIPEVKTLAQTLATINYDAVARAIFSMHEAQVWHADLNAFNILLNQEGQVWLIDFDRARIKTLSWRQRQDNLLRLRRSLVKVAGSVGLAYWAGINQVYLQLMHDKA